MSSTRKPGAKKTTGYKIPLDEQAILRLERIAGHRVHEAATLIQIYKFKCYTGDEAGSEKAKQEMWKLAVKIEHGR